MDVTQDRWSKTVAGMHWVSAVFILSLITSGFVMTGMGQADPMRRALGALHTISGNLLGLLTLARLVVQQRTVPPSPLDVPDLHRKGIAMVHGLLYALTLAVVLTGLATVLSVRAEWHSYLLGEAANPPSFSGMTLRKVHEVLSVVLASLAGAHVIGVVVQGMRTRGALHRMLPFLR